MKKSLLLLTLFALLITPTLAYASPKEDPERGKSLQAQENKMQKSQGSVSSENASEKSIEARTKVEITSDSFEIRGQITFVAEDGSYFTVGENEIHIDPFKSGKYIQKGNVTEGAFVRVKGIVENDILYATEVKLEAQGKFGHPPTRIKVTVDATQSASDTASHTATPSAKLTLKGTLDAVANFLKNLVQSIADLF